MAPAIAASASITHIGWGGLNLRNNNLGDEGWGAIFAGVCSSKVSKIASIDASGERISPKGAKLIAEALRTLVNESLTKVSVWENRLDKKGSAVLRKAVEGRSGFELEL